VRDVARFAPDCSPHTGLMPGVRRSSFFFGESALILSVMRAPRFVRELPRVSSREKKSGPEFPGRRTQRAWFFFVVDQLGMSETGKSAAAASPPPPAAGRLPVSQGRVKATNPLREVPTSTDRRKEITHGR